MFRVVAPTKFTGVQRVAGQPIRFLRGVATVESFDRGVRRYLRRHGFTVTPTTTGVPRVSAVTVDTNESAAEGTGREDTSDQHRPSTTDH